MIGSTIGLDFGTTNSIAATLDSAGDPQAIGFARPDGREAIFPTLLTLWQDESRPGRLQTRLDGGQWAIDAFAEHSPDCRFIKSVKTFAANPHFTSTQIFGARYDFADLMHGFLQAMKSHAEGQTAWEQPGIVIGRPIRFAGASPDAALAATRYRDALGRLGFTDIRFVYEPLAAAYYFVRQLQGAATVFVGDLGGGTSDFSILRVENRGGAITPTPLASRGLGLAGDQFDYRIIQHVVAPALGKGSLYRSFDKELEIPASYFNRLAQWSEFSMLRGSKFYRELQSLLMSAVEPDRIQRFLHFIDAEMMYDLFVTVSETKRALSTQDAARFELTFEGETIAAEISRRDFDGWIARDLDQLDALIDQTLDDAGLPASAIDTVFLTGGTSFVPAVQDLFASRFGAATREGGDLLISVASGLALIGQEQNPAWFAQT